MTIYLGGIILLVLSYFTWAKYLEKILDLNPERKTPSILREMSGLCPPATWKVYLIQLLNIAGLGPIFGALQGALWGPAAYLWIIFGCIFGGAVHDFVAGLSPSSIKGLLSLKFMHLPGENPSKYHAGFYCRFDGPGRSSLCQRSR